MKNIDLMFIELKVDMNKIFTSVSNVVLILLKFRMDHNFIFYRFVFLDVKEINFYNRYIMFKFYWVLKAIHLIDRTDFFKISNFSLGGKAIVTDLHSSLER
jgi:hypothetical protein